MSDVIAAIATGNITSAIGILRLSGPGCARVAGQAFRPKGNFPLWEAPNRKLVLGTLFDAQGRTIDQCMAVYTRAPHSYTGEDTVEIQCHGSPAALAAGLEALFAAGARQAGRGEFTKRAFLNGQMDLTQAEAVIDLIEAETADAAANAAGQVAGVLLQKVDPVYNNLVDLCSHFHAVLDYPDEDIDDFRLASYEETLRKADDSLRRILATFSRGRILKQGAKAAILGRPNAGKSSLLNALAGYDRVIVTDIPGTTRDAVEERVRVGSILLRLMDTAGIRETEDQIEAMGVARSLAAAKEADLAIFVCDGSRPLTPEDRQAMDAALEAKAAIAVINKSDLGQKIAPADLPFDSIIVASAKTGEGLDQLSDCIDNLFAGNTPCDGSVLTNVRQAGAIARAVEALGRAEDALAAGFTPDAVLTDVEAAMSAMGEVTGRTIREDITNRIFERFCVGK